MKLLVISQYYSPDITAAAFRIKESVDGLRDMGVNIHILTSTPHKSSQKIDQKEDVTSNIWRVNVPVFSKPSRINYIIQYLTFCFRSIIVALRIHKDFDYDIIFATSPPITIAFTAFFVRFLTKKPLIVDIRDIWPDSAVAVGKLRKDSIIFKILKLSYITFNNL